jgi:hypothetical protein
MLLIKKIVQLAFVITSRHDPGSQPAPARLTLSLVATGLMVVLNFLFIFFNMPCYAKSQGRPTFLVNGFNSRELSGQKLMFWAASFLSDIIGKEALALLFPSRRHIFFIFLNF